MYISYIAPVQWTVEPVDQEVKLGEKVMFYCEAAGTPLPSVHWVKVEGNIFINKLLLILLLLV